VTTPPGPPLSFPRHAARTKNFTLGRPRSVTVTGDGSRVVFLRSASGTDPANALWVYDVGAGEERLVADPAQLLERGDDDVPAEERARRERLREVAGGIVGYATDDDVRLATFALAGRIFLADLVSGGAREISVEGPVIDPRIDPTGSRVAYLARGALHVVDAAGGAPARVAGEDDADVTWGAAEFVAAEEMSRSRGYWWAPDGRRLLAARVDESPVRRWYIGDPHHPERPPQEIRYPAAGTANAEVTAALVDLDGRRVAVSWDRQQMPYLVAAGWPAGRAPYVVVQTRDQRLLRLLEVDPASGATVVVREESDPHWVDVQAGVPGWLADGRLVWLTDDEDARRLLVGDELVTPPGLRVEAVSGIGDDWVLVEASEEPMERHLYHWSARDGLHRITHDPGVHRGVAGGDVVAVESAALDRPGTSWSVVRGGREIGRLGSRAETPAVRPAPTFLRAGERELRTAVVLPRDDVRPAGPLPVLMSPYGGPQVRMVVAAHNAYLSNQWFADQGFAVIVSDGRGTSGRGSAWDRSVAADLAGPPLADQVDALHAVADRFPGELDLGRVAIEGWSFGGFLAALAVLRRPDVFHAAVAGAPVTDWSLYDTFYTERYLGSPVDSPDVYRSSSLLDDAAGLRRPLMIIHGLADDNVVFAHSLALSTALVAAGRPHTVLPLSGITHLASDEVVAENLLLLQVEFLRTALADPAP
jgi:dipeptidyl-peptidase-4